MGTPGAGRVHKAAVEQEVLHGQVVDDEGGPARMERGPCQWRVAKWFLGLGGRKASPRNRSALCERDVGLGLLEREAVAEEGDEALDARPLLDGLVQDDFITEYNYLGRQRRHSVFYTTLNTMPQNMIVPCQRQRWAALGARQLAPGICQNLRRRTHAAAHRSHKERHTMRCVCAFLCEQRASLTSSSEPARSASLFRISFIAFEPVCE